MQADIRAQGDGPRKSQVASSTPTGRYAELKRRIKHDGLMDPQPVYYAGKLASTLGLLAVGLALLVVFDNTWLLLLDAVYLAFVFGQISLVATTGDTGSSPSASPGRTTSSPSSSATCCSA